MNKLLINHYWNIGNGNLFANLLPIKQANSKITFSADFKQGLWICREWYNEVGNVEYAALIFRLTLPLNLVIAQFGLLVATFCFYNGIWGLGILNLLSSVLNFGLARKIRERS